MRSSSSRPQGNVPGRARRGLGYRRRLGQLRHAYHPVRRPVRSSQAVSQHDRVGLFPNRIICIRSADMLTPPGAANSRQEPGGPGPLLAFDNPGSRGSGISLPGSGTVPEHIRSVRVLRAVPGLSKLAVLSWRSSRGLSLSDTFAAACLHGQWWPRTEPRPLMETQPPAGPGSGLAGRLVRHLGRGAR